MNQFRRFGFAIMLAMALAALVGVVSASASETEPKLHPSSTAFEGTGTLVKSEKIGGVTHNWTSTFTTNGGSGPYAKCETTTFTGTTQAGTTNETTATPHYSNCFSNIGGSLVSATVSTPKEWHFTATLYFSATRKWTFHVTLTGPITISVPAVGCTITVPEQTVMGEGINDTGTPPAGTEINPSTASPLEVEYTGNTGCTNNGVNNGISKYVGAVHIPTVYVE